MKSKASYIKEKLRQYKSILELAIEISDKYGEEGQTKYYQITHDYWSKEGEIKCKPSFFYDSSEIYSFLRFASPEACEEFLSRVDAEKLCSFFMK